MLQSSMLDPVLGLDIHIVEVPAPPSPKPIPTPIPLPYVGLVFDPIGLAVGAAISQALSGNPGVVLVNGMPVTNCGTDVTNRITLPHLPAPGVAFTLGFPRGNAELFFGSQDVSLMGSFGVRLGDVALSCSDPVRLPTSAVVALPKGMPVLNLRPMVLDAKSLAMALAMRGLFAGLRRGASALFRPLRRAQRASALFRRIADRAHSAVDRIAPQRVRSALHRGACFLTGHPVDVATGRLMTDAVDAELPGPLPLVVERSYDSSLSFRSGPLGYGWSHSLDQAVWTERGKVVYRAPDGRELEFHVHDWPNRELPVGYAAYQPVDRLAVRNLGEGRWELENADGVVGEFAPVPGRTGESPLVKQRTRDGHVIELLYDTRGRLEWVRDSSGRLIKLEHDERGRLTSLNLPTPAERGWYRHREYRYDERGDLIEVKDSSGKSWRFEYDGHLLVQETDRTGLSFCFQYDGRGAGAYCLRTWGDGGIYDHVIDYDKINRRTLVTNSLEQVTQYELDPNNLVVRIVDALGNETRYEHDPRTFQVTAETDALGNETRRSYDGRGNVVSLVGPDGAVMRFEYDQRFNEPVLAVDPRGAEWRWAYDRLGHLMTRTLPTGETTRYQWENGLLRSVTDPANRETVLGYDEQKSLSAVRLPNGAENRYHHDGQGRVTKVVDARGGVTRTSYDLEGRQVEVTSPVGVVQRLAYDGEGNLSESQDATRHVRLQYGHFHKLVEREEAGTAVRFEYDTEDNLTAVVNEAGERYLFERDALGEVKSETGFDGQRRVYFRDVASQVTRVLLPGNLRTELAYDAAGRVTAVEHFDGTTERYEYGPDGALLCAANNESEVVFERDALGRVLSERLGDVVVASQYGPDGARALVESSLGARQAVLYDALGEVETLHHGPVSAFWRSRSSALAATRWAPSSPASCLAAFR